MPIIEVNKNNFDEVIKNETVIIDFWASWCNPCRMLGLELEELAKEDSSLLIGKINVDVEEELAVKFNIRSIPHLFIYKKGQLVNDILGYVSKDVIKSKLR